MVSSSLHTFGPSRDPAACRPIYTTLLVAAALYGGIAGAGGTAQELSIEIKGESVKKIFHELRR